MKDTDTAVIVSLPHLLKYTVTRTYEQLLSLPLVD
jgi:hypothetical protein